MVFRNFRLQIIGRVLLLALTIGLFFYLDFNPLQESRVGGGQALDVVDLGDVEQAFGRRVD